MSQMDGVDISDNYFTRHFLDLSMNVFLVNPYIKVY